MCVRVSVYLLRLPYCLSSFCTLSLLVHHHTCLSQVPSLSLFFFCFLAIVLPPFLLPLILSH
jgi:hypothetical protein